MKTTLLSLIILCFSFSSVIAQKQVLASDFVNPDIEVTKLPSIASVSLLSTSSLSSYAEGLIAEDFVPYKVHFVPTASTIHGSTKLDRDNLRAYLETTEAEYVMAIRLMTLGTKKNEAHFPVYLNDNPKDPRRISESSRHTKSDNFYSDLYPSYQLTGRKEAWETAKKVRVQVTIVEVATGTTIWSGFSTYMKPKKLEEHLPTFFDEVATAIHNKQLI